MKTTTSKWLHGLGSALITGISTSGLSALGISGANAVGISIANLNLKQICAVTIIGGVIGAFAYLKQSPLPPEEI